MSENAIIIFVVLITALVVLGAIGFYLMWIATGLRSLRRALDSLATSPDPTAAAQPEPTAAPPASDSHSATRAAATPVVDERTNTPT